MNKSLKYQKILNQQLQKGFISKKEYKKEMKFIKDINKKSIVLS
jgi:hypothetical protein